MCVIFSLGVNKKQMSKYFFCFVTLSECPLGYGSWKRLYVLDLSPNTESK